MNTVFIVDGVAVMATSESVELLADRAIIGASTLDEAGNATSGDIYLCFNDQTPVLRLATLPTPWVPHAYQAVEGQLVRDESSPAWHAHLAQEAARFDALVHEYDTLVQSHMDKHAQAMGYTNMDRAVTYASEGAVKKFQAEGRLLRAWRSRYWAACWPVLEAVRTGQRPIPEHAALLAELDAVVPPPTAEQVQAEIIALGA